MSQHETSPGHAGSAQSGFGGLPVQYPDEASEGGEGEAMLRGLIFTGA
ncbi:MAG TPA: hypothetical protein PLI13_18235 [Paracoccus sp. (in: a-proteobacteria)]|nr:hypothetical protein [Paracoccus sp. (in: a-proteobacteria)]HRM76624.1 hypothetical protein [Paracoccus sp. (in: a-proteobacteria)]